MFFIISYLPKSSLPINCKGKLCFRLLVTQEFTLPVIGETRIKFIKEMIAEYSKFGDLNRTYLIFYKDDYKFDVVTF